MIKNFVHTDGFYIEGKDVSDYLDFDTDNLSIEEKKHLNIVMDYYSSFALAQSNICKYKMEALEKEKKWADNAMEHYKSIYERIKPCL